MVIRKITYDRQHKKAIWVNDNIKPLEIKIINKKDLSWL